MNKERLKKYINKYCIIILSSKFKYEGVLKEIFENTLILNDIKLGEIEIEISSIILITKQKQKEEYEY